MTEPEIKLSWDTMNNTCANVGLQLTEEIFLSIKTMYGNTPSTPTHGLARVSAPETVAVPPASLTSPASRVTKDVAPASASVAPKTLPMKIGSCAHDTPRTKASKENVMEPLQLKHDLDLIDRLHQKHRHTSAGRLKVLIRGLQDGDPVKPDAKSLAKWKYYLKCQDCSHSDMEHPNQKNKHPATCMCG